MDDFLAFLGWYISEGSVSSRSGKNYNSVSICQSPTVNQEQCKIIEDLFKRLPFEYKVYTHQDGNRNYYTIHSTQLATYLAQFGTKSFNKKVPQFIKDLSPRQIDIFLNSYFLGDGYLKYGYRRLYIFTLFANDLQELVLKIGRCASLVVECVIILFKWKRVTRKCYLVHEISPEQMKPK